MTASQSSSAVASSHQLNITYVVNTTYFAYAQSLVLVDLFWAVEEVISTVIDVGHTDSRYSVTPRPWKYLLESMQLMSLLSGTIGFAGALVVFTLPQIFQAKIADLSLRHDRRPELDVLLVLPLTVAIAWYSYDYLTPSNVGLAKLTYEHGLTLSRYATMFAIQAPISLFCICYHHAVLHRARKAWFVLAVLVAVVGAGLIRGHKVIKAKDQFYKSNPWQQYRC